MAKLKAQPERQTKSTENRDPEWVNEMHEHFRKHGFYRAQDLQRVLGDPRESVELRATGVLPFNFSVEN
jgi:hypothetical protein